MNSFIFCTSYINNNSNSHHRIRYQRWIRYYQSISKTLNADRLFLIDDGGVHGIEKIPLLEQNLPKFLPDPVYIYRFKDNLGRSSLNEFPGWWRSFLFSAEIARKYNYKKIIHVESDFFVLSEQLKQYIQNTTSGWTALYSTHFEFPETCMQIICEDAFHLLDKLNADLAMNGYKTKYYAEHLIPFTHVEKGFVGDRLGEPLVMAAWLESNISLLSRLDFMGQVNVAVELESDFNLTEKH